MTAPVCVQSLRQERSKARDAGRWPAARVGDRRRPGGDDDDQPPSRTILELSISPPLVNALPLF